MDNRQEMEKKGEEWRANPGFDLDEVTITRLGGLVQCLCISHKTQFSLSMNRGGRESGWHYFRLARLGFFR